MVTTLSSKGQIVIPVDLRKRYKMEPGTRVDLMDIGGEIVLIPLWAKSPIDEARGLIRGGKTTRQIMKEIRKEEQEIEKRKR